MSRYAYSRFAQLVNLAPTLTERAYMIPSNSLSLLNENAYLVTVHRGLSRFMEEGSRLPGPGTVSVVDKNGITILI